MSVIPCSLLLALALAISGSAGEAAIEGPVVLTVLGTEFTLGPDGPAEPITLGYSNSGGRPWTTLFDAQGVKAGQSAPLGDADDAKLVLLATGPHGPFRSDGRNALVLRGGERLADFLAMNHVRPPVAHQRPVSAIIARYVDANGLVTVTDHQLLVLFEVGTTEPDSPAYDFQDLVVLVTFEDPKALAAVPRRTPRSASD